jgi:hypothetical protein
MDDTGTATPAAEVARILHATRVRQTARLSKVSIPDRPAAFDSARWNRELAADLAACGLTRDEAERLALHTNVTTYRQLEHEASE